MALIRRLWQLAKNVYHLLQAEGWRAYYGWPDRRLTIFGITGTNGKTTTSYILAHILREAYGVNAVGLLSTIVFWLGGQERVNDTKMTTLKSRNVFRYLAEMKKNGVRYVVLEVTSHALDQRRLHGITLAGAVILNLTREHLDYHGTMSAYAAAKQRIVGYLKPQAPLIGKADDQYVAKMLAHARGRGVPVHEFTAQTAQAVVTPLTGAVNKENALAATLVAQAAGVPESAIAAGVDAVRQVPGRFEWLTTATGIRVLIDYAVTPDALVATYALARQQAGVHKVYGVLGACGCRDRGKRPDMARAASAADYLILTREDPWTEPEEQIFQDLEQGLDATQKDTRWQRITDRRDGLRWVLARAEPGDVLVATGKGAERGMAIGHTVVPWHERTVIEELARELGK